MGRLTSVEASRLGDALTRLYAVVPFEQFPSRALTVTERLIGCDHASYNEIDGNRGKHRVLVDPPELARRDLADAFVRYIHQHPVIAHYARTTDTDSHLITDFMTVEEFRKLELYNEFLRQLGTEAQLSNSLVTQIGGYVIGLALNRDRTGFDERDRRLFDQLRPHLIAAHRNALALSGALGSSEPAHAGRLRSSLERLTDRQRDVLRLVASGHTNSEIAGELGIKPATAKKHLEQILERLHLPSRTAAALEYLRVLPPQHPPSWRATIET